MIVLNLMWLSIVTLKIMLQRRGSQPESASLIVSLIHVKRGHNSLCEYEVMKYGGAYESF